MNNSIKKEAISTNENLDQQYKEKLENIDVQLIFILGLHRSGTSILYKLLAATQCFNPTTAYHLIKYNQLIYNHINNFEKTSKQEITEFFQQKGLRDRGIDRLQITADFAEEYGFLLGQKTFQMKITPRNLPIFIEMAKKIQFIADNDKPLLLKNPYDFPNFLYIKKTFPRAKFIFIHRNPFKTLSSTIKAIQFLLQNKNPYTTRIFKLYNKLHENPLLLHTIRLCFTKLYPIGVILLTLHNAKATNYYLKNINKLPSQDYIAITYENLCKNPQEIINDIMNFLNIKTNQVIDLSSYIKTRKTVAHIGIRCLQRFTNKCMKNYFTHFGYQPELPKKL